MGPVHRHSIAVRCVRDEGVERRQIGSGKARMGQVHRTVKNGNAHAAVAEGYVLELA
jgi:hypothetical protein